MLRSATSLYLPLGALDGKKKKEELGGTIDYFSISTALRDLLLFTFFLHLNRPLVGIALLSERILLENAVVGSWAQLLAVGLTIPRRKLE